MDEEEKNSLLNSYSVSDEAIRKLFMDCKKIELYVFENNRTIIKGLIDTKKIIEKTIFANGNSNIYEYKYWPDDKIQQIISKHYKKDDNQSLNPKLIIRTEDGIEIENKKTAYDNNGKKKNKICIIYDPDTKITKKTETEYDNGNKKKTIDTYYNSNEELTEKREREYYENGNDKKRIWTYYNSNEELTEKTEIEYDDNGNEKKRIDTYYNSNEELTEKIEIEYDENRNERKRIDTYYDSNGELTKKTEIEYDDLKKPISQICQKYTRGNENKEAYRSATFNESGAAIVKDKKGNVIKYNKDSDIDIAFAGINDNGENDIIDNQISKLCQAINKEHKKEIAIIHTDIVDKNTIDDVINEELKDNQVLFWQFKSHQVCVAKIGGELFSVGMFYDKYKPKQAVEDIELIENSGRGPCVNLAEIMALFSAKWISERGEKNPETAADDFRGAIKKFAIEYQNEKLYDYYADEALKLRHFIDLPDSVKQKIEALEEYNKLSDGGKKRQKKQY